LLHLYLLNFPLIWRKSDLEDILLVGYQFCTGYLVFPRFSVSFLQSLSPFDYLGETPWERKPSPGLAGLLAFSCSPHSFAETPSLLFSSLSTMGSGPQLGLFFNKRKTKPSLLVPHSNPRLKSFCACPFRDLKGSNLSPLRRYYSPLLKL